MTRSFRSGVGAGRSRRGWRDATVALPIATAEMLQRRTAQPAPQRRRLMTSGKTSEHHDADRHMFGLRGGAKPQGTTPRSIYYRGGERDEGGHLVMRGGRLLSANGLH
jgi:hypothetical protein